MSFIASETQKDLFLLSRVDQLKMITGQVRQLVQTSRGVEWGPPSLLSENVLDVK